MQFIDFKEKYINKNNNNYNFEYKNESTCNRDFKLISNIKCFIIPKFYILIKIHKYRNIKNIHNNLNSGLKSRPIVSNIKNVLTNLSKWISDEIKNIIISIKKEELNKNKILINKIKLNKEKIKHIHYLLHYKLHNILLLNTEDLSTTIDYLNNNNLINNDTLFISLDIVSLYPSISNKKGLEFLHKFINNFNDDSILNDFIMSSMKIILNNNFFSFNNEIFVQISGASMGSPPIPQYAIIYTIKYILHIIHIINTYCHNSNILSITSYIDDILIILNYNPYYDHTNLNNFKSFLINKINDIGELNFTCDINTMTINMLDLNLTINNNKIIYKTFYKNINKFLILPYSNYLNHNIFIGIIKGELIRLVKRNNKYSYYLIDIKNYKTKLLNRGYPKSLINKIYKSFNIKNSYFNKRKYFITKSLRYKFKNKFITTNYSNFKIRFSNLDITNINEIKKFFTNSIT